MKNITINLIGQSVLEEVLCENLKHINFEIKSFKKFNEIIQDLKVKNSNICVTSLENYDLFNKSKLKRSIDHTFCLIPGHDSEENVWYAGTSPQGLFRSEDDGATWSSVDGFNQNPDWNKWTAESPDGYPKVSKLHSILIDSMDKNHMYIGMSYGGVFESDDQGKNWEPLNKGLEAGLQTARNRPQQSKGFSLSECDIRVSYYFG